MQRCYWKWQKLLVIGFPARIRHAEILRTGTMKTADCNCHPQFHYMVWPSPSSGFALQHNTDPGKTNRVNVTYAANFVVGQNQVLISPSIRNNFFRLFQP